MLIKVLFNKYNIGIKNIENFLISQGLLLNKSYQNIEDDILKNLERLLLVTIIKEEILFKRIHDNVLLKFENGSYTGYRRFRGLPVHNQRTKTNSRTSRKLL
jgi:small subunit ribosomal protein S13